MLTEKVCLLGLSDVTTSRYLVIITVSKTFAFLNLLSQKKTSTEVQKIAIIRLLSMLFIKKLTP